jgi:hypothetical protein
MRIPILALSLAGLAVAPVACRSPKPVDADPTWLASLDRWHAERNDEIAGPDG